MPEEHPNPQPDRPIHDQLSNELDQTLLEVVKFGRVVLDREGKVHKIPPTAADLNVVRQRLKDLNLSYVPGADSPAEQMRRVMADRHRLRLAGGDMPAVDLGPDAATA